MRFILILILFCFCLGLKAQFEIKLGANRNLIVSDSIITDTIKDENHGEFVNEIIYHNILLNDSGHIFYYPERLDTSIFYDLKKNNTSSEVIKHSQKKIDFFLGNITTKELNRILVDYDFEIFINKEMLSTLDIDFTVLELDGNFINFSYTPLSQTADKQYRITAINKLAPNSYIIINNISCKNKLNYHLILMNIGWKIIK